MLSNKNGKSIFVIFNAVSNFCHLIFLLTELTHTLLATGSFLSVGKCKLWGTNAWPGSVVSVVNYTQNFHPLIQSVPAVCTIRHGTISTHYFFITHLKKKFKQTYINNNSESFHSYAAVHVTNLLLKWRLDLYCKSIY